MRPRTVAALLPLVLSAPLAAQRVEDPAALLAEAARLEHTDPAGVFALTGRAIPLLRDDSLRAEAYRLRCWAAADEAPDSMIPIAERGIAEASRAGNARAVALLRVCRGFAQYDHGDPALGEPDFDFGVAEGRRLRDRVLLSDALVQRGELRHYRGDYAGAGVDLDEGYRLVATTRDSTRIRSALNAIANLYADPHVGRYDRAIEFYQQLLEAYRAAGDDKEVAAAYFNLGSTLERKGSLEQALTHYRRALAIDARLGDPVEVATDRRAVAVVLYKLNRPAESLREIDRALAAFERAGEAEAVAAARLTRGVALRMLGRHDEALADLEAARIRFRENPRYLEKVEEERALALAAAGRWPEAYAARGDQLALQRRLAAQAQEEQSARLRVQFDAQHREEENRALARANALRGEALSGAARIRRLQRVVIVLSACIILVLVALVIRQIAGARRLSILALTDELTQLPNRRHVLLIAEEHFRSAQHGGSGYSLLMLDLDHFKEINDSFGHAVGDGVLRRVVDVSRQSLRAGDRMGRIGGEEFVAVLPGASASAAREVAERVRLAVEGAQVGDLHPELRRVTVSVGVAVWSRTDDAFAVLLRRADDSLYQAKQRGRNRVVVDEAAVHPEDVVAP